MLDVRITKLQGAFAVDASFAVQETGVTALFGSSGAGKTSIINMVAGLIRPHQGHIIFDGQVLFDSNRGIHVPPEKRHFGYIFQDGRLFPHLSVTSNLKYGMKLVTARNRYVSFDQVVEVLGIKHLLTRSPATLSGGEKQRVAIGRALLASPRLLLMDEPLASLDGPRKSELLPFIARLPQEFSIPILYVTHAVDEIVQLADTMVLLDEGRVIATGNVKEVMCRLDVQYLTKPLEANEILRSKDILTTICRESRR
jgi:molybdate transport system ATP-binding protein